MSGLVGSILFALSLSLVGAQRDDQCFQSLTWTSENGMILANGDVPFHIKGTSWFGFETESRAPHGLWRRSLDDIILFLSDNDFNAVRLPFSVSLILDDKYRRGFGEGSRARSWDYTAVDCELNPDTCRLPPLQLLEYIIDRLGDAGILVLLDQHRISGPQIHDLWYSEEYPESAVLESWDHLLSRVGGKWNLLGLDLKNEPHGKASWGFGNVTTDWNLAAQRIITHIASNSPTFTGLFLVNGVGERADSPHPRDPSAPHWWGGNLEGVHRHPIGLPRDLEKRLVYSPHVYGPDVYQQPYFASPAFPANLPSIWDLHFGFIENKTGRGVVVGEWGGEYCAGTPDRRWGDEFASYLVRRCLSDNFYWALNPNSGETGGLLLSDWQRPRTFLSFLY